MFLQPAIKQYIYMFNQDNTANDMRLILFSCYLFPCICVFSTVWLRLHCGLSVFLLIILLLSMRGR